MSVEILNELVQWGRGKMHVKDENGDIMCGVTVPEDWDIFNTPLNKEHKTVLELCGNCRKILKKHHNCTIVMA